MSNKNYTVITAQSASDYVKEQAIKRMVVLVILFLSMILLIFSKKNRKIEDMSTSTASSVKKTTTWVNSSENAVVGNTTPKATMSSAMVSAEITPTAEQPFTKEIKSNYNTEIKDHVYLADLNTRCMREFYKEELGCKGTLTDHWKNEFSKSFWSTFGFSEDKYNLYDVNVYNTLTFYLSYDNNIYDEKNGKIKIYGGNSVDDMTEIYTETISTSLREPLEVSIDISQYDYIKIKLKGEEYSQAYFGVIMGEPILWR